MPSSTVIAYVTQIASALYYAHSQKVVHRDVKPENMLLGNNNEALLSDFGIAVVSQNTYTQNSQNIAGTVTYMAPEQIQGKARAASDQYALGVVVYEWLCGVVPFSGTYVEVAVQHERVAPTPLRKHVPTIAPDVEQVVLTALEKDPQRRFGSVQAFANALIQAIGGTPVVQGRSQSQGLSGPMQAIGDAQWSKPAEMAPPASTGYGVQDVNAPRLTPPFSQNQPPQLTPSGVQDVNAPRLTPPFSEENSPTMLSPSDTQLTVPPVNQSAYGPQVVNPQHNYILPPPPPMPMGPGFTQQARQTNSPLTPRPPVASLNLNRSNLFSTRVRVLLILLVLLLIAGGVAYYTMPMCTSPIKCMYRPLLSL